ncbi:MAG: dUTP diphosphatase [candidate division WOR-3 bacterium]
MKPVRVRILLLANVPMPVQQTVGAAGFDLAAAESATIEPGSFGTVRTGIAIEMPDGLEAQVRPRSGLAAHHGIGLLNAPGTIDSDYRGEIRVVLFNLSRRQFRIRPGDRIAQLVFSQPARVRLESASRLSKTRRGSGGFGHTG